MRQRLHGLDARAVRLGDRQQAGLLQHPIDEDRAGAAFAGAAALLGAGEMQVVAQEVEQPLMRLGAARDFSAVDRGLDAKLRHKPPPARAPAGRVAARAPHRIEQSADHESRQHIAPIVLTGARLHQRYRHRGGLPQSLGFHRRAAQKGFDLGQPDRYRTDAADREPHILEAARRDIELDQRGEADDRDDQRSPMADLLEAAAIAGKRLARDGEQDLVVRAGGLVRRHDEIREAHRSAHDRPSRRAASSTCAFCASNGGVASAAGEALTILPPIVACSRI